MKYRILKESCNLFFRKFNTNCLKAFALDSFEWYSLASLDCCLKILYDVREAMTVWYSDY